MQTPDNNPSPIDNQEETSHKAGFVSIVGKPNVGKSTLMNNLLGERLSIITAKAQTTRKRIMGILNAPNYQIVYSDTPGIVEPRYELHQTMMRYVSTSLEEADVVLYVVDIRDQAKEEALLQRLQSLGVPLFLIINKVDLLNQAEAQKIWESWQQTNLFKAIFVVSALEKFNLEGILGTLVECLPVHPPFFPKDDLSDQSERFFAAEIIREKIFLNYEQEIPYCSEVIVTEFKESEKIIHIRAEILVERDSQKGIIIGKGGSALKKTGTDARKSLEEFFQKQVFLEQYVKVIGEWRKQPKLLKRLGYE